MLPIPGSAVAPACDPISSVPNIPTGSYLIDNAVADVNPGGYLVPYKFVKRILNVVEGSADEEQSKSNTSNVFYFVVDDLVPDGASANHIGDNLGV